MISIQDYALPATLEEAYEVLTAKKSNTILGGCAFLRMGSKKIAVAVDLAKLGLDFINESDDNIEIGAMTTFRNIETSPVLAKYFNGVLPQAVSHIVGVQLRNSVTVGATVYSRYGFSDFITALLSLDADVVLYKGGQVSLETFLENGAKKDILVKVIIPKTDRKAAFQTMRNSRSDYAVLNAAVSNKENDWKVVVGARPQRAKIARAASHYLAESQLTKEDIEYAAELAANELTFGSNIRGSGEYREAICKVLVKRAIMEVLV